MGTSCFSSDLSLPPLLEPSGFGSQALLAFLHFSLHTFCNIRARMDSAPSLSFGGAARRLMQENSGSSPSSRKLLQPVAVTDVPPDETRYFDQNIALILAAMLCAVISVLGLASMVRCALRCRRGGRAADSSGHVTVRLENAGMKKAAIKALPTAVFLKASQDLPKAQAADCPICLAEFAEGETVRVLPLCSHSFHVECIDTWLLSHTSCPSCRHSLLSDQTTDAALPCDSGNSWVVAIHQSSVAADGMDASIHVEKTNESFRGVPRDTPHRFLP